MANIYKISFIFLFTAVLCFSFGTAILAQSVGGASVQTNSATNVSNNQATLNGYLAIPYISGSNHVYFQWGTSTDYNNQNTYQYLSGPGSFSRTITGLNTNTVYHFRAVAQGTYGTIYGQDMTFYTSNSGYYGTGALTINKQVINLTSRNLNWQTSVSAKPLDILSFAITLQAGNQDLHNVVVRDVLPANLNYKGNLTVNASLNYSGNPSSGINIGTIPAGGITVIAYQAQVAPSSSFVYGITTLSNTATITGSEIGTQSRSATVVVNNSLVYGATAVSTGLTNNLWVDSFFLPLVLIIGGLWLYFSGKAYSLADKIKSKIE